MTIRRRCALRVSLRASPRAARQHDLLKGHATATLWEHLPAAAGAPPDASPVSRALPPVDLSLPEPHCNPENETPQQQIGPYIVREVSRATRRRTAAGAAHLSLHLARSSRLTLCLAWPPLMSSPVFSPMMSPMICFR